MLEQTLQRYKAAPIQRLLQASSLKPWLAHKCSFSAHVRSLHALQLPYQRILETHTEPLEHRESPHTKMDFNNI